MAVMGNFAVEADPARFDRVLSTLDRNTTVITDERDPSSPTDKRTVVVRADEGEALKQFHEACIEHEIVCEVRRIRQDLGEPAKRLASATEQ